MTYNQQAPLPHVATQEAPVQLAFVPDKECKEILNKTHKELRESLILLAIKHFSTTDIYKQFYLDKDKIPVEEKQAIENSTPVQSVQQVQPVQQQVQQPQQQPQVAPTIDMNWD